MLQSSVQQSLSAVTSCDSSPSLQSVSILCPVLKLIGRAEPGRPQPSGGHITLCQAEVLREPCCLKRKTVSRAEIAVSKEGTISLLCLYTRGKFAFRKCHTE